MHYSELEELYDKCGGKFRFAVLLQKRIQQLVQGDKKLVPLETDSPMAIAVEEVREGKIWLEDEKIVKAAD